MTMHLEKAHITTTRYNGKQKKSKSKRLAKAQADHEAWLESMGVGKNKDALYDKWGKRIGLNEIPDYREHQATAALSNRVACHGPAREQVKYTGERKLLGVATMHKSNMVPVFADRKEDAKEIAAMRR
jgi:hypothetical protein